MFHISASRIRSFVACATLSVCSQQAPAVDIHVPGEHRTIQAALDTAQPGDVVVVEPGTYRERVTVGKGVTLRSADDDQRGDLGLARAEATIIDGSGGDASQPGVTMSEASTIDGFTVTGVGQYDDELWKQHHATQGNNQSHEHIGQPGVAGISIRGVTCRVVNNIVHHIGYTGIAIDGNDSASCSPVVKSNACYRNMGGGIGVMRGAAGIIEGNDCFENFYAGVGHDNASPIVIDNDCHHNIRAGIGISEGACPTVRGNRCHHNRRAGIGNRTGESTRPLIVDNDCFDNDMAGIGAEEEAAPVITGNRCYRNRMAGIGAESHAKPVISNNECYENEMVGIGQRGDAVTALNGNFCHHNKLAGIGYTACESGRSTLTNNRVADNGTVAIGIGDGWIVTATGNDLSRTGGLPPIVMVAAKAKATFAGNTIHGDGVAGFRVAGTLHASGNKLVSEANRKGGPPNIGIWGLKESSVASVGNEFTGWRTVEKLEGVSVSADGIVDPPTNGDNHGSATRPGS